MAAGNLNGISSDNLEEILSINDMHNNFNMYILSNHKGINGAACILYSDVITILPSKSIPICIYFPVVFMGLFSSQRTRD